MSFLRPTRFFIALTAAVVAVLPAALAPAAAETRAYLSLNKDPRLPDCTASSVQSAVTRTLSRAKADYAGGVRIKDMIQIRETAYRENGVSPLARRFCSAKASLSDGTTRTVHYKVEEHAGFVGVSWNVEACIWPLDKWHVYGAHCQTVRPR